MYVTLEETRTLEVWVDTEDFDEALEIVQGEYCNGNIDTSNGGTEIHALVGDAEHSFCEIAAYYF